MKAFRNILRFLRLEDGVVTVEWVALAGGLVVAAIAVSFILENNLAKQSSSIPSGISSTVTGVYGTNGTNLGQ